MKTDPLDLQAETHKECKLKRKYLKIIKSSKRVSGNDVENFKKDVEIFTNKYPEWKKSLKSI